MRYWCCLHVHVDSRPAAGGDPAEVARRLLATRGWSVRPQSSVVAENDGAEVTVILPDDGESFTITAHTQQVALHAPRSPDPSAECPRCGEALTESRMPKRRHELWWRCQDCGWLGYQRHEGEPLAPMHPLEGSEADCGFCGEERANLASEPWEHDGERFDWVVCRSCGRSNSRHG